MDPLSGKPHFPTPEGPLNGFPTVNPRRQLAQLKVPSALIPLPSPLPASLKRKGAFTSTHTLSVHILPAAFPRAPSTYGKVEVPSLEYFAKGGGDAKKAKGRWINETAAKFDWEKVEADKTFPDPKAGVTVSEEGLWSTILRIRRNEGKDYGQKGKKGITLVATHPIGFHKEIWEPTFKRLLELTERDSSPIRIEEIWSLDAATHGDAALLNGPYLPKLPDRSDYGRDLANFLVYFLPTANVAFGNELPLQLPRVSTVISKERLTDGYLDRSIIGLGHSLGGDALAVCALSFPKLFVDSAIILMETTMFPPSISNVGRKLAIYANTVGRRSSWSSREEARKALLKSPLFRAFDPAVFDVYIEHGMYDDPKTGQVHLKCYPSFEASEYTERRTMSEGWELLPTLDEKIEMRWVMGGLDEASNLVGGPHVARRIVWRRLRNSSNVKIPGGGHLVVQEKPKEVAEDVALFLQHKFGHQMIETAKAAKL